MCLALLAAPNRYFSVDFLGEAIFLGIVEGRLHVREFYDCVFEVSEEWKAAQLVCMSPHDLLRDGTLAVNLQPEKLIPAKAVPEDTVIYDERLGYDASYGSQIVTIKSPGVTREGSPISESYSGLLLHPQAAIPEEIRRQDTALEIMRTAGTVFRLHLGNLEPRTKYAMRLVVEPYRLIGLKDSFCVQREPNIRWRQEARIFSPKTCRFDFEKSLERIRSEMPEMAPGAAILADIVLNHQEYPVTLPVRRHRILLISQGSDCMERRQEIGEVWHANSGILNGHYSVEEWTSGTNLFWENDPECLASQIWKYLKGYGGKIKEEITSAHGISHESCSLVVDELTKRQALAEDDTHRFWVADLQPFQLQTILEKLASDPDVHTHLCWRGYVIPYVLYYEYMSPAESAERARDNWWKKAVRIISVTALIVGTTSLLIGVLNLIRGIMR